MYQLIGMRKRFEKGQIFSVRVSEKILHGPAGNLVTFPTECAMEGRNLYTSSYREGAGLQDTCRGGPEVTWIVSALDVGT